MSLIACLTITYGQDDEIYLVDDGTAQSVQYKESFMGPELKKLELEGKYGIQHKGHIVIPVEYDELPMQYSDWMIVKKAGKYGIIDKRNRVQFDFVHEAIKTTNNKDIVIASIQKGDYTLFGAYTAEGVILSDFEYRDCNEKLYYQIRFPYTYSCTCLDGSEKFFDGAGKLIHTAPGKISVNLSNEFYRILKVTDDFEYYHGVIDSDLNVIIEPVYNQVDWVYEDRYFCLTMHHDLDMTVRIYDAEKQEMVAERSGFFRQPNKEGYLNHNTRNEEGKWEIKEIHIDDLIGR